MSLASQRDLLLGQLKSFTPPPIETLPTNDRFLLTSCLQKSLRRGDRAYAFAATSMLLQLDAPRLWRRLVIVVFEDFGRSNLELTADIVAAASNKAWRQRAGGDWRVASLLVDNLLRVPRDRFLDDLGAVAGAIRTSDYIVPASDSAAAQTVDRLIAAAVELTRSCERPVPGTKWHSVVAGACDAALSAMHDAGLIDDDQAEFCLQGRRTSQCMLPVLLPLWLGALVEAGDDRSLVTCGVPPLREIDGLPSYAFDGYTRLGRAALWELHRRNRRVERLTSHCPSMTARIDALQFLLFEVEGGILTGYLAHPIAEELQARCRGCLSGLRGGDAIAAQEEVRAAIPELNEIRHELWLSARAQGVLAI